MSGYKSGSGRELDRLWGVNARHALYHQDGTFYELLTRFPGALFDKDGFILFSTEEDYRRCSHLKRGKKLNVPGGIRNIPNYEKVM